MGFHLDVTHWLADRMVASLLNLVFNIIDIFKLPSNHLNIIRSPTLSSRRIIITNLSRVIMLLTRHHIKLKRFIYYYFLISTNRLPIHIILLLLRLHTRPNRVTFMLFNWSMLTIIISCFAYGIYFTHLNNVIL